MNDGVYGDLQLGEADLVLGIVARGFITRHASMPNWVAPLIALPEGVVARDSDAIAHYQRGPDGVFREYYGWDASTAQAPIFVLADEILPAAVITMEARSRHAFWLFAEPIIQQCVAGQGADQGLVPALHIRLNAFFVAMARQATLAEVEGAYGREYQAVMAGTVAALTWLNPDPQVDPQPTADDVTRQFFDRFYVLASAALPDEEC